MRYLNTLHRQTMRTTMGETTYKLDNGYSIKAITDMDHFNTLRPVWNGLLESHTSHVPFLCFDWFKIWLKRFLKDNGLLILLLCKGGSTVAIAPFIIRRENFKGIMRARKVCLIGNVHSPIRNFIFGDLSNEARQKFSSQILLFFRKQFRQWDVMELDSIPEEDHCFDILRMAALGIGLKGREYTCFNDWVLDEISYCGDEYISRLPKNLRKELGKKKRRLQRRGDLTCEVATNKNNFDYCMRLYYTVRKKSWKHTEADKPFLSDFRKFAMEKGWLKFTFLFFNGSPISCHLRLLHNNATYFMESTYDLEYRKYSPTTILRSELIKYVIDKENVNIIHTIRGDEAYKKDWTPIIMKRAGIEVFNNNVKGQFLAFLMTKVLPIVQSHEDWNAAKKALSKHLQVRL